MGQPHTFQIGDRLGSSNRFGGLRPAASVLSRIVFVGSGTGSIYCIIGMLCLFNISVSLITDATRVFP